MTDQTRRVIRRLVAESLNERLLLEKMTEQQFEKTFKVIRKYIKNNPEKFDLDPNPDDVSVELEAYQVLYGIAHAAHDAEDRETLTMNDYAGIKEYALSAENGAWFFKRAQDVVKALKSKQWLDSQEDPPEDQVLAAKRVLSDNAAIVDILHGEHSVFTTGERAGSVVDWYEKLTGDGVDIGSYGSILEIAADYVSELNARIPPVSGNFDAVLTSGATEVVPINMYDITYEFPFRSVFGDLYPEVVVPRYFAVSVADYEACASQGSDARWCTGFGRKGEHTREYIENAPLFVIYADENIETPPGVASGLPAPGNFKKIAQAYWRPGRECADVEVNDVANRRINWVTAESMMLAPFLCALYEETKDWRDAYEPPEDGPEPEPEIETEYDENGNPWEWDPGQDYELVHAGSELIAERHPYSGFLYHDRDFRDIDTLIRLVDGLSYVSGVGSISHPADYEHEYYYILDDYGFEEIKTALVREVFQSLRVLAEDALRSPGEFDPRTVDEDGYVTSIENFIDGASSEVYAIVPRIFADWVKTHFGAVIEYFDYDVEDIDELLRELPMRAGIGYTVDDGVAEFSAIRVASSRDNDYLWIRGEANNEVFRRAYERAFSINEGGIEQSVMEWLRDAYIPVLENIAQALSNKERRFNVPAYITGGNPDFLQKSLPVSVSVDFPLEQAEFDPDSLKVVLPYVQWIFNGVPFSKEDFGKYGVPGNIARRDADPFRTTFGFADVSEIRDRDIQYVVRSCLDRFLRRRSFEVADSAEYLAVDLHALERIYSLRNFVTESPENRGVFASAWIHWLNTAHVDAQELGRSVVTAEVRDDGDALFARLISLYDTDPITSFFQVEPDGETLSFRFDGDVLFKLFLYEAEDPFAMEDYLRTVHKVVQAVWRAVNYAKDRSDSNPVFG